MYQGDGNLVLYDIDDSWNALWASGTSAESTGVAYMQGDGNLVIYDAGDQPVYSSGTSGNSGAWLCIDDSGTIAIVRDDLYVIWFRPS